MRLFDRYIVLSIVKTTILVGAIVLCLDLFFSFVAESKYVTRYDHYKYTQAAGYIALSLPAKLTEFLPSIVLIGSLLGMGLLASNNELVAMRASGYSKTNIVMAGMKAGLIFSLIILLMNQFVTPQTKPLAKNYRLVGHGKPVSNSLNNYWSKIKNEQGETFVRVGQLNAQGVLNDVMVLSKQGTRLNKKIMAQSAVYERGQWVLHKGYEQNLDDKHIQTKSFDTLVMGEFLPADVYTLAKINPRTLPLSSLYEYTRYLKANHLDYYPYQRAFWNKISSALSILIMILIAMPFVFSDRRSGNAGARLLVGIVVGMTYHIFSQVISNLGQIYQWNALASAFAPLLVFAVLGIVLLKRT